MKEEFACMYLSLASYDLASTCVDSIQIWSWSPLGRTLNCLLVVDEEFVTSHVTFKMADNPPSSSDGYFQYKTSTR